MGHVFLITLRQLADLVKHISPNQLDILARLFPEGNERHFLQGA
jgi:hypothetical protein